MLFKIVTNDKQNLIITDLVSVRVAIELRIGELTSDKNIFHLFTTLEAWFEVLPDGFPRHCEPRLDQSENIGGFSFTEELSLTRHHVKKALKAICSHYKSEEECEQAEDKFKGKFYCSVYRESDHHRTYYYRNHEKFDELYREWTQKFGLSKGSENETFSFKI